MGLAEFVWAILNSPGSMIMQMFVIEHRIDESRRAITDMVVQLQHNKHLLDKEAKQPEEVIMTMNLDTPDEGTAEPATTVQVNELKNCATPLENSCAPKKLPRGTSARLAHSGTRTGIPVKSNPQPSSIRLAEENERHVRSAIVSTPTRASSHWSKK